MTNHLQSTPTKPFRILALDGGGAKGFYTIGVLKEIEAMVGQPLHQKFDLIFGTSTGAIIAALLALGNSVDAIHALYKKHVPAVMSCRFRRTRTEALARLSNAVFGDLEFSEFKTGVGIVTAKWMSERPMIFKNSATRAHGSSATFDPGFGVPIADAVQASCSAFPFFNRKFVTTSMGDKIELIDGGYCANNPTLYAIADGISALEKHPSELRVVNVGVGEYPKPKNRMVSMIKKIPFNSIDLLQKTLEINTQSMDQLRTILFKDVPTIRISNVYSEPEMATDLLEANLGKLNVLRQRGRESFAKYEDELRAFLI
jgi:uncharacterized protein